MNLQIIEDLFNLEKDYEDKFNNKKFPLEYYECDFLSRIILLKEAISKNTELANLERMGEIREFIEHRKYEENRNKCLEIYKNKRR